MDHDYYTKTSERGPHFNPVLDEDVRDVWTGWLRQFADRVAWIPNEAVAHKPSVPTLTRELGTFTLSNGPIRWIAFRVAHIDGGLINRVEAAVEPFWARRGFRAASWFWIHISERPLFGQSRRQWGGNDLGFGLLDRLNRDSALKPFAHGPRVVAVPVSQAQTTDFDESMPAQLLLRWEVPGSAFEWFGGPGPSQEELNDWPAPVAGSGPRLVQIVQALLDEPDWMPSNNHQVDDQPGPIFESTGRVDRVWVPTDLHDDNLRPHVWIEGRLFLVSERLPQRLRAGDEVQFSADLSSRTITEFERLR